MIVNFIEYIGSKNIDITTKYEVFCLFKMIVNFINTLALKTLILLEDMKCLSI